MTSAAESIHEVGEDVTERARRLVAAADRPDVRTLPTDVQSEIGVLVTTMRSTGAMDVASSIVTSEMFSTPAHRAIWKAAMALRKTNEIVDPVTVQGWLVERNRLDAIGGIAYLNHILDSPAEDGSAEIYAKTVRRLSLRRGIILTCERMAKEGYSDASDEYAEKVEREVYAASRSQRRKETLFTLRDASAKLADRFGANGGSLPLVPTGLADLDRQFGGFRRPHLVVVAARPGMGKSAFMGGTAIRGARHVGSDEATAVLILSAEMSAEEVAGRMLAAEAMVTVNDVMDGASIVASRDKMDRVIQAAGRNAPLALWIDERSAPTLEHVRSQIRRVKAECERIVRDDGLPTRLRLVELDYIQIAGTVAEPGKNRDRELSEYTSGLKQIAKDEDLCVVALSQLNRSLESRPNKRPILSDLRESGAIEQDADVVMFLYRDEYYNQNTSQKGIAEIIIAKRRGGKAGTERAFVKWVGEYTQFADLTPSEANQLRQEALDAREPSAPPQSSNRYAARRLP